MLIGLKAQRYYCVVGRDTGFSSRVYGSTGIVASALSRVPSVSRADHSSIELCTRKLSILAASVLLLGSTGAWADDPYKEHREAEKRYWEHQKEIDKARMENARERRKFHEEMDREERKHYEEMDREEAKRRAEYYRERDKANRN